jgi:hypothetical protein
MHDESEPLGPGNVVHYAALVANGTADPIDARRLLSEFVRQASTGSVSSHLIEHLRACIAAFLAGKKVLDPAPEAGRVKAVGVPIQTLEKALGLSLVSTGRPPIDANTKTLVAADVLRRRLSNESHQDALASVAKDRKRGRLPVSSATEVGEAWAAYKCEALTWVRLYRASGLDPSGDSWAPEEMKRLRKIYAKVDGAVFPGGPATNKRTGKSRT